MMGNLQAKHLTSSVNPSLTGPAQTPSVAHFRPSLTAVPCATFQGRAGSTWVMPCRSALATERSDCHPLGIVLLVAGEAEQGAALCSMLTAFGMAVVVAEDGMHAVQLALSHHVDFVLIAPRTAVMDDVPTAAVLRAGGYGGTLVALADAQDTDARIGDDGGGRRRIGKTVARASMARLLRSLPDDPDHAAEQLAHLPEYAGIRARFEQAWPGQLATMVDRHAQADWRGMTTLAHQIKGTAGAFGHFRAGLVAGGIERALRTGNFAQATSLLGLLVEIEQDYLVAAL